MPVGQTALHEMLHRSLLAGHFQGMDASLPIKLSCSESDYV